ncbi:DUF1738 domain-containing protein [Acetobacteraceae bacterium]|nr:DUF1738 domain-containing protein [Acetobacteraceae bacterium]
MAEKIDYRHAEYRSAFLRLNPIKGDFDVAHLKAIHSDIFQRSPILSPGQFRSDARGDWRKQREFETIKDLFPWVAYSPMDQPSQDKLSSILEKANPKELSKLNKEQFTKEMASLYANLDYIHPFLDGNTRTLRIFTQQLSQEAGYDLRWERFNRIADRRGRDILYIARDMAVNEIALPNIRFDETRTFVQGSMDYFKENGHTSLEKLLGSVITPYQLHREIEHLLFPLEQEETPKSERESIIEKLQDQYGIHLKSENSRTLTFSQTYGANLVDLKIPNDLSALKYELQKRDLQVEQRNKEYEASLEKSEGKTPMPITSSPKATFAEKFATKVIEQLENGTAPWLKPWEAGALESPYNPVTNHQYSGMNNLWLQMAGREDPRWMTYKQAKETGAQVRRGEKSLELIRIIYDKEVLKKDENGKIIKGEDGKALKETVPLDRPIPITFNVFNAEQIDGLPELERPIPDPDKVFKANARGEAILKASGAEIEHKPSARAFYSPLQDTIILPQKEQFHSESGYYATALHELGHWTGHESRLNRDIKNPFGSIAYAQEELRAEIGSMMLAMELGTGFQPSIQLKNGQTADNHLSYIQSWVSALKNDPEEIIKASRDASKIKDFVMGFEKQMEQENLQESTHTEERSEALEAFERISLKITKENIEQYIPQHAEELADAFNERIENPPSPDHFTYDPTEEDIYNSQVILFARTLDPEQDFLKAKDGFDPQNGSYGYQIASRFNENYLSALAEHLDQKIAARETRYSALREALPSLELDNASFIEAEIKDVEYGFSHNKTFTAETTKDNTPDVQSFADQRKKEMTESAEERLEKLNDARRADTEKTQDLYNRSGGSPYVGGGLTASQARRNIRGELSAQEREDAFNRELDRHLALQTETKNETKISDKPVYISVPYKERKEAKKAGAQWSAKEKSWFIPKGHSSEGFEKWLNPQEKKPAPIIENIEDAFYDALREQGLKAVTPIRDGEMHSIATEKNKGSEKSGYYIIHENNGHPLAYIGNHQTGSAKAYPLSGVQTKMSASEIEAQKLLMAQRQKDREEKRLQAQEKTAKEVSSAFLSLKEIQSPTPYMQAKGLSLSSANGLKTDQHGNTIVPMMDISGKQWNQQTIYTDGSKRFAKDGKKEGTFFPLSGLDSLKTAPAIIIAEGLATGASIHEAQTGGSVVVAFDSGQLLSVAKAIHKAYPEQPILIAADDDRHCLMTNGHNVGKEKAFAAAKEVGARVVMPVFLEEDKHWPDNIPKFTKEEWRKNSLTEAQKEAHNTYKKLSDFNDLAQKTRLGKTILKNQFRGELAVIAKNKEKTKEQQRTKILEQSKAQARTSREQLQEQSRSKPSRSNERGMER